MHPPPHSAHAAARLLVQIHSEFGCRWHLQNNPQGLYQAVQNKPKAAPAVKADPETAARYSAPEAVPGGVRQEAYKPSEAQDEAMLGAIEAEKLASAAAQKASSLEELKTALQTFKGCESLSNTATQLVFSDGVPHADVMIIGEAPGAEEDRQGKPFVGASGQLLDLMLSFIGLHRDKNFYITNTVFWRPAGNRTPTDSEMNICAPFVKRHIELAMPKILLLVGNTSVKRFFASSVGITKLRGSWGEYKISVDEGDKAGKVDDVSKGDEGDEGDEGDKGGKSVPMLATFHPAYLLRNPLAKRDVWQDLRAFKTRMEELGIKGE